MWHNTLILFHSFPIHSQPRNDNEQNISAFQVEIFNYVIFVSLLSMIGKVRKDLFSDKGWNIIALKKCFQLFR